MPEPPKAIKPNYSKIFKDLKNAIKVLQSLNLPYRIIAGDF
jgi:hypothetical protein